MLHNKEYTVSQQIDGSVLERRFDHHVIFMVTEALYILKVVSVANYMKTVDIHLCGGCVFTFLNHLQVWWAASDLGWVVGHSYICYGPLLHGNTTVLYEVEMTFKI